MYPQVIHNLKSEHAQFYADQEIAEYLNEQENI